MSTKEEERDLHSNAQVKINRIIRIMRLFSDDWVDRLMMMSRTEGRKCRSSLTPFSKRQLIFTFSWLSIFFCLSFPNKILLIKNAEIEWMQTTNFYRNKPIKAFQQKYIQTCVRERESERMVYETWWNKCKSILSECQCLFQLWYILIN